MSPAKLNSFTSPLADPLGHLRSKSQIAQFANSICSNCLSSYYSNHTEGTERSYLDTYSKEITTEPGSSKLGFCYMCNTPVDPDVCGTAYVGDEYPVHICDECNLRTTVDIAESFESMKSSGPETTDLAERLRDRLKTIEESHQ